jgi:hypothetical protein
MLGFVAVCCSTVAGKKVKVKGAEIRSLTKAIHLTKWFVKINDPHGPDSGCMIRYDGLISLTF